MTTTHTSVFAQLLNTSATIATTSNKKYTVAGTSLLNGEYKVRLANNLRERTAVLRRNGHEEIKLVQLATAMTESEALVVLLSIDFGTEGGNAAVAARAAELKVTV